MKLLLLRHGEAGFNAPSDVLRPLTDNGRYRLRHMLKEAGEQLSELDYIVHSPYLRTTQTAELVLEQQQVRAESLDLLVPESDPRKVLDWLTERDDQVLMLVTHQPLIGNLVSLLCEGDLSRPEPMMPGALAIIELEFPAAGLGRLQVLC